MSICDFYVFPLNIYIFLWSLSALYSKCLYSPTISLSVVNPRCWKWKIPVLHLSSNYSCIIQDRLSVPDIDLDVSILRVARMLIVVHDHILVDIDIVASTFDAGWFPDFDAGGSGRGRGKSRKLTKWLKIEFSPHSTYSHLTLANIHTRHEFLPFEPRK